MKSTLQPNVNVLFKESHKVCVVSVLEEGGADAAVPSAIALPGPMACAAREATRPTGGAPERVLG